MECRCYKGGEGRTKMKRLKYAGRDFAALVLSAAVIAAVYLVQGLVL
jgi:energy-coupling factor transport system permease protein